MTRNDKMRIVHLSSSFAKNMGYSLNILPRYLSELGADVHIVAADLLVNHYIDGFANTYGSFAAAALPPAGTVEDCNGYTLHTMPHERKLGQVRIKGLLGKLKALKPDIVQVHAAVGWLPLEGAAYRSLVGYKFYTGNHTTASVFPLAQRKSHFWEAERIACLLTRTIPGWLVSQFVEKCYTPTEDCALVAMKFFGVPARLIDQAPLGVDTRIFFPRATPEGARQRAEKRADLGVQDGELLCIYTGRFAEGKNPLVLAKAVEQLRREGLPFRAVFVGDGAQRDALGATEGSIVHPFVPFHELAEWFNAADIGVWPTQESTSMLDAAACGLPIVVNDTLVARERINGNGLTYRLNDSNDLARVLRTLLSSDERRRLGDTGARRMADEFSWEALARDRMADYEHALHSK